jgi:hypothetical protein
MHDPGDMAAWPPPNCRITTPRVSRCIIEEVVPWIYHNSANAAIVSGSQTRIAVKIVLLIKLIVITVRVRE